MLRNATTYQKLVFLSGICIEKLQKEYLSEKLKLYQNANIRSQKHY